MRTRSTAAAAERRRSPRGHLRIRSAPERSEPQDLAGDRRRLFWPVVLPQLEILPECLTQDVTGAGVSAGKNSWRRSRRSSARSRGASSPRVLARRDGPRLRRADEAIAQLAPRDVNERLIHRLVGLAREEGASRARRAGGAPPPDPAGAGEHDRQQPRALATRRADAHESLDWTVISTLRHHHVPSPNPDNIKMKSLLEPELRGFGLWITQEGL